MPFYKHWEYLYYAKLTNVSIDRQIVLIPVRIALGTS